MNARPASNAGGTPTAAGPGIRVWLEPGYDYGRAGAWMLDFPGCFAWAQTREGALERARSAVGGFVDWCEAHGEALPLPADGRVTVVEEVEPTSVGGYERNATFTADARPVDVELLEAVLRRARHARADLRELVGRVQAHEAARGPLPEDEPRPAEPGRAGIASRPTDALLRHLGGAEVWLAGRLDRSARYDGPGPEGDLEVYLEATRGWAVDQLRALQSRAPELAGTDGKGETWTLFKVLRRFLYHSLDHLDELDRRFAMAEDRAARLDWREDGAIEMDRLDRLLRLVGRPDRAADRARLARLLDGSTRIVTAWDGPSLVAIGRAVHDGASDGLVSMVCVHPRWQGRGVGHRLMERLMTGLDEVQLALRAAPGTEPFYAALGYVPDPRIMVRPRRA